MQIEISLIHVVIALASLVFLVIGTLVSIFLPLLSRSARALERLDAKLDPLSGALCGQTIKHLMRSLIVQWSNCGADNKALDEKLDRSVEQLRADNKALDEKLDRSVEQLRADQ